MILTTVIALVAILTGLGFIFRLLLEPVYDRLSQLEAGQNEIKKHLIEISKKT